MIRFARHIPTFVDSDPAPIKEFDSVQDLLSSLSSDIPGKEFSHWARSKNAVMGVWNGGTSWWVMGFADGNLDELPEWKSVYEAIIDGKRVRLPDDAVRSSCGDKLTLNDGRVLRNANR